MAAAAATFGSFSSTSTSLIANTSFICLQRRIPLIRACATATKQPDFNISFGVPPKKETLAKEPPHLFIPWILRDQDGNLKLQSKPPPSLLNEKTPATTKKKKKTTTTTTKTVKTREPRHSKSARRFYNQNFREPQRLSKILATAGDSS